MVVLYTFKSAWAPNHLLSATSTYQVIFLSSLFVTGLVWPYVGCVIFSCFLSYCAHRLLLNKRLAVPPKSALVITGCSTGLGFDAALHLAKLGYVVFAGVRKDEDAQKLVSKARSEKSSSGKDIRVVPLILDVTNQQQIEASVRRVSELCTKEDLRLHGLINNAGYGEMAIMELIPMEKLRKQYEVNVFGQVAVTQAFLPLLRASALQFQSGPAYALSGLTKGRSWSPRIVFVSSVMGKFTAPGVAAYCSSKFAIESLADGFRRELYRFGIDVAVVQPGAVVSGFHATATAAHASNSRELGNNATFEFYRAELDTLAKANMHPPIFSTTAVTNDAFAAALLDARPHARYQAGADSVGGVFLIPAISDHIQDFLFRHFHK